MSNVHLLASTLTAAGLAACAVELPQQGELEQHTQPATPVIDARRSLAITDAPILARFPLERVMMQLASGPDVSGPDASTLWRQLWDVFNPGPGLGLGPHCDDSVGDGGVGSLNGYPFTCRPAPAEGAQASCDPFAAGSTCAYIPIGLFMRFDLAREDGAHCGEYRIVYARDAGRTDNADRALVIFEAAMRNPHVNQGVRGCQRLVRTWAELSDQPDITARADLLEEIYFEGWQEFDPVVQWSNFGDNPLGAGQVRTNQFMQPLSLPTRIWSLRELKLRRTCPPGAPGTVACTLSWVPVTDKVNPFGPLFAVDGGGFQDELVDRVPMLVGPTLGSIGLQVSDIYNSGQSQAGSATPESNYVLQFGAGPPGFRAALDARLAGLGSTLTADHVVARAQAMSCAGCHRFSNNADLGGGLVWPPSLGFTHVSERDVDLEVVDGVTRFKISIALTDSLLPARAQLITDFLDDVPRPVRPPDAPLGGRWVH
jgi:hypothetical protein